MTRAGTVTGNSTVTWGLQCHRVGSRCSLGQQCSSFLQRVLQPCHPRGPCPAPPACSSPATTAMPRAGVTAGSMALTLTTHPMGALGFCSSPGGPCTAPPPSQGAPGLGCPCVPCCPFCHPGLGLAGSPGPPGSLLWGGMWQRELGQGQAWPQWRAWEQGQTQVATDPPLCSCPSLSPALYATCYRL